MSVYRLITVAANETDSYLKKIRSDSTFKGALGRPLTRVLYTNRLSPKSARNVVCNEILMTIPVAIFTKKDFFLLEAFNEKIQNLKAAGLIEFWDFRKSEDKFSSKSDLRKPKVLNLNHLEGSFLILLVGTFISFVVFVIEILFSLFSRFMKADYLENIFIN